MKTYILLLSCLLSLTQISLGQNGTPIDLTKFQSKIENEAIHIQTLIGTFTQQKTIASLGISIESNGKFFFKKNGNKFRWEYLSPTQFVIIYADEQFTLKQFENINGEQAANTVFSELNKILLQALNGKLKPSRSFEMSATENTTSYEVLLTPSDSELSSILKNIKLTFHKTNYSLMSIALTEQNEDKTLIQLNHTTKNTSVSDNLFK